MAFVPAFLPSCLGCTHFQLPHCAARTNNVSPWRHAEHYVQGAPLATHISVRACATNPTKPETDEQEQEPPPPPPSSSSPITIPSPPSLTAKVRTPVHYRVPFIGLFIDDRLFGLTNLHLARRYGPVYRTDVLGLRSKVITDLQAVREILRDAERYNSGGAFFPTMRMLLGTKVLVMSDGKQHAALRARVAPAFTSNVLPFYFPLALQFARRLWRDVYNAACRSKSGGESSIRIDDAVRAHYLRLIVAASMMGMKPAPDEEIQEEINLAFVAVIRGMFWLPVGPTWRRAKEAHARLVQIIKMLARRRMRGDARLIQRLRGAGVGKSESKRALETGEIDLLLTLLAGSHLSLDDDYDAGDDNDATKKQNKSQLKEDAGEANEKELEIVANQMVELWIGGYFNQTSTTLSCLGEIARQPDTLSTLLVEQASIAELSYDTAGEAALPYLSAFVTETQRLYPSVHIWYRRAAQHTNILGHGIAPGDNIILDLWSAQRCAITFKNPDEFDPLRFYPGNPCHVSTSASLAYGAAGGPHFCVGAALARIAMNTTLAVLLREFNFEVIPCDMNRYESMPEVKPRGGVFMRMCTPKT